MLSASIAANTPRFSTDVLSKRLTVLFIEVSLEIPELRSTVPKTGNFPKENLEKRGLCARVTRDDLEEETMTSKQLQTLLAAGDNGD
jgi:hypothetical protein